MDKQLGECMNYLTKKGLNGDYIYSMDFRKSLNILKKTGNPTARLQCREKQFACGRMGKLLLMSKHAPAGKHTSWQCQRMGSR